MTMTKKALIEAIESDGQYYNVKVDFNGDVTGVPAGESSHYHSATNTGGRRLIGKDTELLAALIVSGQVSEELGNSYRY